MGLLGRREPGAVHDAPEEPAAPVEKGRAAVQAGVPGRCPDCDGFGYIDNIDMINRTQSQHCRDCGRVWSFSFDEEGEVIDLTDSPTAQEATPRAESPGEWIRH